MEFLCPIPFSLKLKRYVLCQSKPVVQLTSKILLSDWWVETIRSAWAKFIELLTEDRKQGLLTKRSKAKSLWSSLEEKTTITLRWIVNLRQVTSLYISSTRRYMQWINTDWQDAYSVPSIQINREQVLIFFSVKPSGSSKELRHLPKSFFSQH